MCANAYGRKLASARAHHPPPDLSNTTHAHMRAHIHIHRVLQTLKEDLKERDSLRQEREKGVTARTRWQRALTVTKVSDDSGSGEQNKIANLVQETLCNFRPPLDCSL
eukprot:1157957-Pelagomonas_calceolata.AAC.11